MKLKNYMTVLKELTMSKETSEIKKTLDKYINDKLNTYKDNINNLIIFLECLSLIDNNTLRLYFLKVFLLNKPVIYSTSDRNIMLHGDNLFYHGYTDKAIKYIANHGLDNMDYRVMFDNALADLDDICKELENEL